MGISGVLGIACMILGTLALGLLIGGAAGLRVNDRAADRRIATLNESARLLGEELKKAMAQRDEMAARMREARAELARVVGREPRAAEPVAASEPAAVEIVEMPGEAPPVVVYKGREASEEEACRRILKNDGECYGLDEVICGDSSISVTKRKIFHCPGPARLCAGWDCNKSVASARAWLAARGLSVELQVAPGLDPVAEPTP